MRVELTAQHVIGNRLLEPGDRITLSSALDATPKMIGLDVDGIEAVRQAKIRAFGRWLDHAHTKLLDDPPIERPLEENQPVPRLPSGGPR